VTTFLFFSEKSAEYWVGVPEAGDGFVQFALIYGCIGNL
jgi:hypothetical protein